MADASLIASGALTVITALAHSILGESRLIGPLIRSGAGVMSRPLARQVLRLAWHVTSLIWMGQALLLFRAASNPQFHDRPLILGLGVLYVGIGLGDAILTRGRHIGWPLLLGIGVFALLSLA